MKAPDSLESNVSFESFQVRSRVPIVSPPQVEVLGSSESILPFGQMHITTDLELSRRAFAFRVEKPIPDSPGIHVSDLLVVDPGISPEPGDFVLCRAPLAIERYTTANSDRAIGVLVEHHRLRKT